MCLGIPGEVISVEREPGSELVGGKVRFGAVVRDVDLSFTPDVGVGDYVVVHVGFAISAIDEDEARQTLAYLRQLGVPEAEGGAGSDP